MHLTGEKTGQIPRKQKAEGRQTNRHCLLILVALHSIKTCSIEVDTQMAIGVRRRESGFSQNLLWVKVPGRAWGFHDLHDAVRCDCAGGS